MIYGTAKKSTKSGPSGPIFITKILQKIQETYGNIFENIIFRICESGILKRLEGMCTYVVICLNVSFFLVFYLFFK